MRESDLFVGVAMALSTAAIALAAPKVPLAEAQGAVSPPAGTRKAPGETESYWSPERMRDAQPAPMPHPQPDGAKAKSVAPDNRPADAKPGATPAVKPK